MHTGRVVAGVAVAVRDGDEVHGGARRVWVFGGYLDHHGMPTGTSALAGEFG